MLLQQTIISRVPCWELGTPLGPILVRVQVLFGVYKHRTRPGDSFIHHALIRPQSGVCRGGAHFYLPSSEQRLVQGHGRPHRLLVCKLDIGEPGEPKTTNQDSGGPLHATSTQIQLDD